MHLVTDTVTASYQEYDAALRMVHELANSASVLQGANQLSRD